MPHLRTAIILLTKPSLVPGADLQRFVEEVVGPNMKLSISDAGQMTTLYYKALDYVVWAIEGKQEDGGVDNGQEKNSGTGDGVPGSPDDTPKKGRKTKAKRESVSKPDDAE